MSTYLVAPERPGNITLKRAPESSTLGSLTSSAQEIGIVTAGGQVSTLGWILLAAASAFLLGYLLQPKVQAAKQRARRRAAQAVAHSSPTWQLLVIAALVGGGAYYVGTRRTSA